MATLPGTWRYRVSAGTGLPGVSTLWLSETADVSCKFYLSMAAHTRVWADPSLRDTSMQLSNQQATTAGCSTPMHYPMLRGLRNFLNTDKPEHHSTDHLKERGVEKGSGWHSTLQGRERSVFNQTNIGTVLRATLGRLLRDGAEHVWAFPSTTMPCWAEPETEPTLLPTTLHPVDTLACR